MRHPSRSLTRVIGCLSLAMALCGVAAPAAADHSESEGFVYLGDVSQTEGDQKSTYAAVPVMLSRPRSNDVTISYTTGDGTAAASSDYVPETGTLTIPAGQISGVVSVFVKGDRLIEGTERFYVLVTQVVGASGSGASPDSNSGYDGQGEVKIWNDDAAPTVAVGDVRVHEGDTDVVLASFNVRLSAPRPRQVSVAYSTVVGTANGEQDFVAQTGRATFAPGVQSTFVSVVVRADRVDETDETFTVRLSDPSGTEIVDAVGVGTILDDDPSSSTSLPVLRVGSVDVREGDEGASTARLALRLSRPSTSQVTARFATAATTATAGRDFKARSGTVTFPANTTSAYIDVPVLGDPFDEGTEHLTVELSEAVGATLGNRSGRVRIVDNDNPPRVDISNVVLLAPQDGEGFVTFSVRLAAPSTTEVTVNYTSPRGYVPVAGTLRFAPGRTVLLVRVPVHGYAGSTGEGISFDIELSNPVGATAGDMIGTVYLYDHADV